MKIALTFDIERDIPNVLGTDYGVKVGLLRILETLDNYNIKGTFFCTGDVAEHYPEHLKLIEDKGHEIACHSLNHEHLNVLTLEKCQELIDQNKKILQNICQNSEIIGFRAPYLKPPMYIFKVLNNLEFKYDSSISSRKDLNNFNNDNNYNIQEFQPLNIIIRFPLSYHFLRKYIRKKELIILFFHPWEAIDIKKLMSKQLNKLSFLKNILFRPDRWINTGNSFISKINRFIQETINLKAEFVTLKQLIIEGNKST